MYNKLLASISEHQEVCNTNTEISANGGNEDLVHFFFFICFATQTKIELGTFSFFFFKRGETLGEVIRENLMRGH